MSGNPHRLGCDGLMSVGSARGALALERAHLRTVDPSILDVAAMSAAIGRLRQCAEAAAADAGQPLAAIYDVSDEERARASRLIPEVFAAGDRDPEEGVRTAFRALACDPTNPAVQEAFESFADVHAARRSAIAQADDLLSSARARLTLAFAEEVTVAPQLLAYYASKVGPEDDATLVIYAKEANLTTVESDLRLALSAARIGDESCPDMLAVVVPRSAELERELARRVHMILNLRPHPGAFGDLPPFDTDAPPSSAALSAFTHFLPISWLDERSPIVEFAAEDPGVVIGPNMGGRSVSARVTLPHVRLYSLHDVTVFARSSAFVSDSSVIIERVPGADDRRCEFEEANLISHGHRFATAIRPVKVASSERGFFLAGFGYWNYYHWMLELLPKLRYWRSLTPELRAYPLMVGERTGWYPSLLEALRIFIDEAEILILKENHVYQVDHLLHINAPNATPVNLRNDEQARVTDSLIRPDTIHDWRARVGLGSARTHAAGRRLFLARRGDRRSYNQADVLGVFVAAGFEPVYLDGMSLREQIDAISSAEFLAGPTGAAWTNLIFSSPGTTALCWTAEQSMGFSSFSTIASIVGVDLRYLTYPVDARSTRELHHANYHLEITEVEQALDELLAGSRSGGTTG
ncbi:MAG: glycosyltransferase family 61 protein [Solirubrobacteraceae bacterium]